MINFRSATIKDIKQIQQVEKEYYENFNCSKKVLKLWIEKLPENFIIAEQNRKIIGFIFFEYLDRIKALPFIHKPENKKSGKFAYVSEVAVLDKFECILQKLYIALINEAKKNKCKKIIWLTGRKKKHDKIEIGLLSQNGFIKNKNIKRWEAYPNCFVSDHWIWEKQI